MAINRDKIQKACEDMCRVFDELELTPEERGIVCSSGYKAAKIKQMDEEIQNDIIEMLQKPTLEENMMKVFRSEVHGYNSSRL